MAEKLVQDLKGSSLPPQEKIKLARSAYSNKTLAFPAKTRFLFDWACNALLRYAADADVHGAAEDPASNGSIKPDKKKAAKVASFVLIVEKLPPFLTAEYWLFLKELLKEMSVKKSSSSLAPGGEGSSSSSLQSIRSPLLVSITAVVHYLRKLSDPAHPSAGEMDLWPLLGEVISSFSLLMEVFSETFRPTPENWVPFILALLMAHQDPFLNQAFQKFPERRVTFEQFLIQALSWFQKIHQQAPAQKKIFALVTSKLLGPLIVSGFSQNARHHLREAVRTLLRELLFHRDHLPDINNALGFARTFDRECSKLFRPARKSKEAAAETEDMDVDADRDLNPPEDEDFYEDDNLTAQQVAEPEKQPSSVEEKKDDPQAVEEAEGGEGEASTKRVLAYQRALFEELRRLSSPSAAAIQRQAVFCFLDVFHQDFLKVFKAYREERLQEKMVGKRPASAASQRGSTTTGPLPLISPNKRPVEFDVFMELVSGLGFGQPASPPPAEKVIDFVDVRPLNVLNGLLQALLQSGVYQVTNDIGSKEQTHFFEKIVVELGPLLETSVAELPETVPAELCSTLHLLLQLNHSLLEPRLPEVWVLLLSLPSSLPSKNSLEGSLVVTYGRLRQLDVLLSAIFGSLRSPRISGSGPAPATDLSKWWSPSWMSEFASCVRNLPPGQSAPLLEIFVGELVTNYSLPTQDLTTAEEDAQGATKRPKVVAGDDDDIIGVLQKLPGTPVQQYLMSHLLLNFLENVRVSSNMQGEFDGQLERLWATLVEPMMGAVTKALSSTPAEQKHAPGGRGQKKKRTTPWEEVLEARFFPVLEIHLSVANASSFYSKNYFTFSSLRELTSLACKSLETSPETLFQLIPKTSLALSRACLLWAKLARKDPATSVTAPKEAVDLSLSLGFNSLPQSSLLSPQQSASSWNGHYFDIAPSTFGIAYWNLALENLPVVAQYTSSAEFSRVVKVLVSVLVFRNGPVDAPKVHKTLFSETQAFFSIASLFEVVPFREEFLSNYLATLTPLLDSLLTTAEPSTPSKRLTRGSAKREPTPPLDTPPRAEATAILKFLKLLPILPVGSQPMFSLLDAPMSLVQPDSLFKIAPEVASALTNAISLLHSIPTAFFKKDDIRLLVSLALGLDKLCFHSTSSLSTWASERVLITLKCRRLATKLLCGLPFASLPAVSPETLIWLTKSCCVGQGERPSEEPIQREIVLATAEIVAAITQRFLADEKSSAHLADLSQSLLQACGPLPEVPVAEDNNQKSFWKKLPEHKVWEYTILAKFGEHLISSISNKLKALLETGEAANLPQTCHQIVLHWEDLGARYLASLCLEIQQTPPTSSTEQESPRLTWVSPLKSGLDLAGTLLRFKKLAISGSLGGSQTQVLPILGRVFSLISVHAAKSHPEILALSSRCVHLLSENIHDISPPLSSESFIRIFGLLFYLMVAETGSSQEQKSSLIKNFESLVRHSSRDHFLAITNVLLGEMEHIACKQGPNHTAEVTVLLTCTKHLLLTASPSKRKMLQNKIPRIVSKVVVLFQQGPSVPSLEVVMEILSLVCLERDYELTTMDLNLLLNAFGALETSSITLSEQDLHSPSETAGRVHNAIYQLLFALVKHRAVLLFNTPSPFVHALKRLLRSYRFKGKKLNTKAQYTPFEIIQSVPDLPAVCLENLARVLTTLAEHSKQFNKHSPILIHEYILLQSTSAVTTSMKKALLPGIYSLMGISNDFSLQQLMSSLDGAGKSLLKDLRSDYTENFKFQGKV